MLIDQENSNIFPLSGKPLKCLFNSGIICLAIDNEKILLRIWRGSDMLSVDQHSFHIC
jgi:hypothetical protein